MVINAFIRRSISRANQRLLNNTIISQWVSPVQLYYYCRLKSYLQLCHLVSSRVPRCRRMYWSDCSVPATIQSARIVDGGDRQTLISDDQHTCITDIAIDFDSKLHTSHSLLTHNLFTLRCVSKKGPRHYRL